MNYFRTMPLMFSNFASKVVKSETFNLLFFFIYLLVEQNQHVWPFVENLSLLGQ
jgi:hypothetical protein